MGWPRRAICTGLMVGASGLRQSWKKSPFAVSQSCAPKLPDERMLSVLVATSRTSRRRAPTSPAGELRDDPAGGTAWTAEACAMLGESARSRCRGAGAGRAVVLSCARAGETAGRPGTRPRASRRNERGEISWRGKRGNGADASQVCASAPVSGRVPARLRAASSTASRGMEA